MAKWISPAQRAEQERSREAARIVALVRGEVDAAVAAIVATWQEVPSDWMTLVYGAAENLVRPEIPTDSPHKHLLSVVVDRLMASHYAQISKRRREEQRARERAAEALVDVNRPVVATVAGHYAIGDPVIVEKRVLICIGGQSRPRDYEDNEDGGYYSVFAEPTDAERATEPFMRVQAQVDERRADDERQMQRIAERRQAELDAIRAEGREPTLFEDMFAGTSDN